MNPTVKKILIGCLICTAGLFALAFALGYYDGYTEASGRASAARPVGLWILTAVVVGILAFSMWVSVLWMRSIDEAAREAHKSAWFWGGTGGMAVGFSIAFLALLPQAANWQPMSVWRDRTDPAAYMVTGAFYMVLVMTAGYTIAWIVWWLRRR